MRRVGAERQELGRQTSPCARGLGVVRANAYKSVGAEHPAARERGTQKPKGNRRQKRYGSSLSPVVYRWPTQPEGPDRLNVEETKGCLQASGPCAGQRRLMVTIGSEIVAIEFLSNKHAYQWRLQKPLAT